MRSITFATCRSPHRSEKSPIASSPEIRVQPSIEHGKLAERTSEIFKKACYRCHGEDGSSEGGFNFVVNLEKLSRTLAKPKDLSGSQLLKRHEFTSVRWFEIQFFNFGGNVEQAFGLKNPRIGNECMVASPNA